MSMHLEGPWLSKNGKYKGKQKYRSAEQAKQARELAESWEKLNQKYKSVPVKKTEQKSQSYQLRVPPGRETKYIPSIDLGHTGAVSSKPPQMYTGSNVLGVTIVHKSCLQPVFSKQEAIDASKMRR